MTVESEGKSKYVRDTLESGSGTELLPAIAGKAYRIQGYSISVNMAAADTLHMLDISAIMSDGSGTSIGRVVVPALTAGNYDKTVGGLNIKTKAGQPLLVRGYLDNMTLGGTSHRNIVHVYYTEIDN